MGKVSLPTLHKHGGGVSSTASPVQGNRQEATETQHRDTHRKTQSLGYRTKSWGAGRRPSAQRSRTSLGIRRSLRAPSTAAAEQPQGREQLSRMPLPRGWKVDGWMHGVEKREGGKGGKSPCPYSGTERQADRQTEEGETDAAWIGI